MNLPDSDKPHVCHNALQTSLIRDKSEEEFRALLIAKSSKRMQRYEKNENESIFKTKIQRITNKKRELQNNIHKLLLYAICYYIHFF